MDLNGLYSALQPRRIVRLGVRTAGYLAASSRLDVHNFPELQSPKARTRAAESSGGDTRRSPPMTLDRLLQRAGRDTLEARDAVRCKPRQRRALEQTQDAKLLDATTRQPLCRRHNHPVSRTLVDQANHSNDCSPLDLSFPSPTGRGKNALRYSPPDWMRGCRVTRGRR